MEQLKYNFRNDVTQNEHIITLSGIIAKRTHDIEPYIDAKMVLDSLKETNRPVRIRLNSPGGDATQGIEIYNFLKDFPYRVIVEITGWAASAASIIAMGADEIVMNIGTTMMIHNAKGSGFGTQADLLAISNMIGVMNESIVDIYHERTGKSKEKIVSWMNEEKTFKASECVELGFADTVNVNRKSDVTNQVDIEDLAKAVKQQIDLEDKEKSVVDTEETENFEEVEEESAVEETKAPQLLKSLQNLGGK